jgi:peptide deformylase
MTIRPIISLPDPRLRLSSEPISRIDAEIHGLIEDMFETMYDAPGIGLAAIQIGVPKRLVVIDTAKKDEERRPLSLINPEIIGRSAELSTYEEGCLSIPDYYGDVERPAQVRARYLDRDGRLRELDAEGVLATALQHEIDHLNGILFIDYLSKLRRDRVMKKFIKAARRDADANA